MKDDVLIKEGTKKPSPDSHAWIALKDICDILEIQNPSQVANRLDDDEKKTVAKGNIGNPKAAAQARCLLMNQGSTLSSSLQISLMQKLLENR